MFTSNVKENGVPAQVQGLFIWSSVELTPIREPITGPTIKSYSN